MNAAGVMRIRIFSGVHLGAELVLSAGETLLGSDDSCDIILMDQGLAPRHALLRCTAPVSENAAPSVQIVPVDSAVLINNTPVAPDGAEWPASTACVLGPTTLAWARMSDPDPWHPVLQALTPSANTSILHQDETESAAEEAPTPVPDDNNIGEETSRSSFRHRIRRMVKLLFRTIVLLSCLGAVAVSYEFRPAPSKINKGQLAEILNKYGFADMQVSQSGGFLAVRGTVQTDAQRLQILRLAQSLQSPVYLNVQVRSDRSGAIAHAFAQRGFFPHVVETSNSTNTDFLVRGYMKDTSTENTAFAAVEEDFQSAGILNFKRTICHAQDVITVLEPLLASNKMTTTQIEFLPGIVLLSGTHTSDQREILQTIMSDVQQHLDVPIPFEIVPAHLRQAERGAELLGTSPKEEKTTPPHSEPYNFAVTGVTLAPLRFITLDTGECVFEGGVLPSGHILEGIDTNALQLSKDGVRSTYTLRGTND
ncbi:hypothetical protein MASR1M90_07930 [Desulfovibrionales bacterium]